MVSSIESVERFRSSDSWALSVSMMLMEGFGLTLILLGVILGRFAFILFTDFGTFLITLRIVGLSA